MARALLVIDGGRYPVAAVCRTLGVARSNIAHRRARGAHWRDRRGRPPCEDSAVLEALRRLAMQRPTYGYRRLWALLRRQRRAQGLSPVNAKRIYRLAKVHKFLLQRYTGSPPVRVHEGTVAVERSDQRYCSDGLEITCDIGEKVRVTFSLDCCDRQAIAFAATTAGISNLNIRSDSGRRNCPAAGGNNKPGTTLSLGFGMALPAATRQSLLNPAKPLLLCALSVHKAKGDSHVRRTLGLRASALWSDQTTGRGTRFTLRKRRQPHRYTQHPITARRKLSSSECSLHAGGTHCVLVCTGLGVEGF